MNCSKNSRKTLVMSRKKLGTGHSLFNIFRRTPSHYWQGGDEGLEHKKQSQRSNFRLPNQCEYLVQHNFFLSRNHLIRMARGVQVADNPISSERVFLLKAHSVQARLQHTLS